MPEVGFYTGLVGLNQTGADGETLNVRQERDGCLVVIPGNVALFEVASRGMLYSATGAVAGVSHGTSFGATPPLALLNPDSSPVALVVSHATVGYVSGTLGTGGYQWGATGLNGAPTASPLATQNQSRIFGFQSKGASVGLAYSGANHATEALTPQMVRQSIHYSAFAGGAAVLPLKAVDDVQGGLVVLPGGLLVLQGVGTAGTSPLLIHSIAWYEVPRALVS